MGDISALVDLLRGRRIVALTGAGLSTDSGIPDYRGPGTLARARNPIQFRAFVEDPAARQRYWARSMSGWPRISAAAPNDGHRALVKLERLGIVSGVITQNVDRLHREAGARRVVELHGALADVVCLGCGAREDRAVLQERLSAANPGFVASGEIAPDGDAELTAVDGFRVADCVICGGVLKPDVVFFGENVPKARVEAAYAMVDEASALLVVGTSLTVFSGFRFVRRAADTGRPVAIVTIGPTRGDPYATVRLHAALGDVLPELAVELEKLR